MSLFTTILIVSKLFAVTIHCNYLYWRPTFLTINRGLQTPPWPTTNAYCVICTVPTHLQHLWQTSTPCTLPQLLLCCYRHTTNDIRLSLCWQKTDLPMLAGLIKPHHKWLQWVLLQPQSTQASGVECLGVVLRLLHLLHTAANIFLLRLHRIWYYAVESQLSLFAI